MKAFTTKSMSSWMCGMISSAQPEGPPDVAPHRRDRLIAVDGDEAATVPIVADDRQDVRPKKGEPSGDGSRVVIESAAGDEPTASDRRRKLKIHRDRQRTAEVSHDVIEHPRLLDAAGRAGEDQRLLAREPLEKLGQPHIRRRPVRNECPAAHDTDEVSPDEGVLARDAAEGSAGADLTALGDRPHAAPGLRVLPRSGHAEEDDGLLPA